MIRSLLKQSQLDLDNSRNDVVPAKKTKLDVYASVHPEGVRSNCFEQDSSIQHSRDISGVSEDHLAPQSQSETIEKGRYPDKMN